MRRFSRENLTRRQLFEQGQIDYVMRRTGCDYSIAVDYLEVENWQGDIAAVSFLKGRKLV